MALTHVPSRERKVVKDLKRELPKRALDTFTDKYVLGSTLPVLPERTKESFLTYEKRRELQASISQFDLQKAEIVELLRRMLL